jgi:hypothetical protein
MREVSPAGKLAVAALLVFLLLSVGSGTGGIVSYFKDRAAAERQAEWEQERQLLKGERDAAIERERALAVKSRVQDAVVAAAGERAKEATKKMLEEEVDYENKMRSIDMPVDDDSRRARIREKLAQLYPAGIDAKR